MTVLQRGLKSTLEFQDLVTSRDNPFRSQTLANIIKTVSEVAAIGMASIFVAYMFLILFTLFD